MAYMPKEYKQAQAVMRKQLQDQWPYEPLTGPVALSVELRGEGRGDIDNIVGAFLDSAKDVLFVDDRVVVIPSLTVTWEKAPKKDSLWIVRITGDETPIECKKEQ